MVRKLKTPEKCRLFRGLHEFVITLCGERGITFGDPLWGNPATPNYSQFASLIGLFVFNLSSLRQAWLGQFKNKKPAVSCGSNLSLRREGDSNPRYSYPYGSLANCWFKPLTHLSLRPPKDQGATKIGKPKLSAKYFTGYLKPSSLSIKSLKFSLVSSSRSDNLMSPSITSARNRENMKLLGISFSLTYSELAIVMPSLVLRI